EARALEPLAWKKLLPKLSGCWCGRRTKHVPGMTITSAQNILSSACILWEILLRDGSWRHCESPAAFLKPNSKMKRERARPDEFLSPHGANDYRSRWIGGDTLHLSLDRTRACIVGSDSRIAKMGGHGQGGTSSPSRCCARGWDQSRRYRRLRDPADQ